MNINLIIKCLFIVVFLITLTYITACPKEKKQCLWSKKQTIWLAICWIGVMPMSISFFSDIGINFPRLELLTLIPVFVLACFIWYITFRMKMLNIVIQWCMICMLFEMLLLEHLVLYYFFKYDKLYDGVILLPFLGFIFFFVFQSIKELFFNQLWLNAKWNYIPVDKKVRFVFLTSALIGCICFMGFWGSFIYDAWLEEKEGYYWVN